MASSAMAFLAVIFRWLMDPYQDTPEPLPPTMRVLVPNRKRVLMRFPLGETRQWRHSRRPPSFIARLLPLGRGYDTAPACFYRICQFAVLQDTLRFRNEIEYFCHRQWPIATLPDPRDESDPERLAFLAGLTRILCASFNARIAMGLHRDVPAYITNWEEQRARPKIWEVPPVWAERTPPLDRQLRIAAHEGDPGLSDHLQEMGILMKEPHYLFT